MKKLLKFTSLGVFATGFSSLAFAGGGVGSITVVPFAPAEPVPAFSTLMLAVLTLLMFVIAVRVFRAGKGNLNRMASIVLVTGGLVLGGYVAQSTYAGGLITIDPGDCAVGVTQEYPGAGTPLFENQCPNALVVTDNSVSGCGPSGSIPGNCSARVLAQDDTCDLAACLVDDD